MCRRVASDFQVGISPSHLGIAVLPLVFSRYLIDKDELSSFLATIRNEQPVSWSKVRSEVERFNLLQDADRHWEHCFGDTDPR